jgi:hypothetical protein
MTAIETAMLCCLFAIMAAMWARDYLDHNATTPVLLEVFEARPP